MTDESHKSPSRAVKMTRRIVVEVYATAAEADAVFEAFQQVGAPLNARALYHHRHSAPCCVQAPYSAFESSQNEQGADRG